MTHMLTLPQPEGVAQRVLHLFLLPQTQPWVLFISAELRWQKCHHWACGEGKAKKIKGISDEMLICFRKQVGVAGPVGLQGYVKQG